ncbi:MAG: FAD-dependent oxidoreductase [Oligosphaeraceae bacterium]|nr:FAD-dependent oxidoreductase [Oligosphaeraceae bacterium]
MWQKNKVYDVVVCGAGPAGFAAALAAARCGAAVLLLEQAARPGGVAVTCGCPGLMGCSTGERQLASGIGEELIRRLNEIGAVSFKQRGVRPLSGQTLNEDVVSSEFAIALMMNRMLQQDGVDLLYYCTLYGCRTAGRQITAVDCFCAGEQLSITGKAFVDCTGDAILAKLAGYPVYAAASEDSMTKTVLFQVSNLQPFSRQELRTRFTALQKTFPFPNQDNLMLHPVGEGGAHLLNITLTAGDPLDPADLTRMDIELREQIPQALQWLRDNFPEFKDCVLDSSAARIGVRNGRQILGRETITCQDLNENTPVSEPVALGRRSYGGHGGSAFTQNWAQFNPGTRGIPYGALLSPAGDNLVVGGRAISIEPRAITAIRLMLQCFASGQAAGVIAAMTATQGRLPDYPSLRAVLLQQNLLLE